MEREVKQLYLDRVLRGNTEAFQVFTYYINEYKQKECLQKFKIKIEAPPRRKHIVFVGGAVLANLMRDRDTV